MVLQWITLNGLLSYGSVMYTKRERNPSDFRDIFRMTFAQYSESKTICKLSGFFWFQRETCIFIDDVTNGILNVPLVLQVHCGLVTIGRVRICLYHVGKMLHILGQLLHKCQLVSSIFCNVMAYRNLWLYDKVEKIAIQIFQTNRTLTIGNT